MAQIAKYIQEAIAKCQEAFDMAHDEDDTKTGAEETIVETSAACDIKTIVEDTAGNSDETTVADVAVTGNLVEVAA
jgi:hypothetical protein